MIKELKPCPFCGARAQMFVSEDDENAFYVECDCCLVRTDDYFDKNDAVEVWNRRTTINPDEWDNALRTLVQAISKISKLVKNEI